MMGVRERYGAIVTMVTIAMAVVTQAAPQEAGPSRYEKLPEGAYAVVAEVRSKPGKEDELRRATLPLVEKVRNEPNNLLYFLHEDREAPGHFVFYEIFASQKDFEAHNRTPHVQAWFARLPELAEGGVKVTHMGILGNRTRSRQ
jgi:quinol monooxygenase YgiN